MAIFTESATSSFCCVCVIVFKKYECLENKILATTSRVGHPRIPPERLWYGTCSNSLGITRAGVANPREYPMKSSSVPATKVSG